MCQVNAFAGLRALLLVEGGFSFPPVNERDDTKPSYWFAEDEDHPEAKHEECEKKQG
jgi:hypothetical protein